LSFEGYKEAVGQLEFSLLIRQFVSWMLAVENNKPIII